MKTIKCIVCEKEMNVASKPGQRCIRPCARPSTSFTCSHVCSRRYEYISHRVWGRILPKIRALKKKIKELENEIKK